MKKEFKSTSELKSVIDYIIWNYDENVADILKNKPEVIVQDLAGVFIVDIIYIKEVIEGNLESDPILSTDAYNVTDNSVFTLLKTESYRQLTKYVEDICDQIRKNNRIGVDYDNPDHIETWFTGC